MFLPAGTQTFTATFSEPQRKIIAEALALAEIRGRQRAELAGRFALTPDALDAREEVKILRELFEAIPEEEAKNPGICHGLCY